MKRFSSMTAVTLILTLLFGSTIALASSTSAAYVGGTAAEFKGTKKAIDGHLNITDETNFEFAYSGGRGSFKIPYANFIDMEYGQKSGRRVGAAAVSFIFFGPVGLLFLFSKKQQHFLTLGYRDESGKEQVALFKLDKDAVRTVLPILEARSGKKVTYQSKGAEKKATK